MIEKSPSKQRFAQELGATEFLCTGKTNVQAIILERTGGLGVDFAFECVGSGVALQTALAVTRPAGTVCLSGVIPHPIEFNWNDVLAKEKAIVTTNAYNDEFPMVIAMLNDGRLRAEPMITQSFSLNEALGFLTRFEELGSANIKMLIDSEN